MTARLPGSEGAGRAHVVTVRFDDLLLRRLRTLAEADGMPVSQWVRNAVGAEAIRRSLPQVPPGFRLTGWYCAHMQITAGIPLSGASCGHGCQMQPRYEALPLTA